MEKEFKTLSEKIKWDEYGEGYAFSEHIKEFIKIEGKLIDDLHIGKIDYIEFVEKRRKLAGKDLI